MAFNTPLTKSENIVFGRGILYIAPLDDNGVALGERDMGEVPAFTLSMTSTRVKIQSHRSGLGKTILDVVTSIDLAAKMDVLDMSKENQAVFFAGSVRTVTQASTPVVAERIFNLEANREYQLGTSGSNPTGVRGVGSVSVKVYELANAVARANTTAYVVGDIFKSTTNVFLVTTAGTTAGSAPTFDTAAIGNPTTDGSAVVKYIGTTAAFTAGTDYVLNAESARIGTKVGGAIALATALYTSVTGTKLSASVDYTPAANSRDQVISSGAAATKCQLRFISDNATGDNRDLFIAACNVSPSGDNAFITDQDASKFSLDIGVNEKNSSIPSIIIDGRAYT